MSTDFERDVSAALHRAADQLSWPGLDVGTIRRGGRRRRIVAFTAAPLATAVLAAAVVIGVLQLPALLKPSIPHTGGAVRVPTAAHSTPFPSATRSLSAPAPPKHSAALAIANLRAFYGGYLAAQRRGQAAVDALIRSHTASWYAPVLEVAPQSGFPPDCAPDDPVLAYGTAGLVGGQAVMVVSSADGPGQVLYSVVTADPGTGMITGVACPVSGTHVTASAAGDTTSALYSSWLSSRRQGAAWQEAVARILGSGGGPESASPYLAELQAAPSWQELTYDPLLCTSAGLPDVSVTGATVVAGGSAGVVTLAPGSGQPIVAVVVLGAQGFTVADVACHQP